MTVTEAPRRREPATRAVGNHPEKASQTLLGFIDNCAYSGALYLDYKGGVQKHNMARGEAIHKAIETCTNMIIASDDIEIPPEVAKDVMQAVLEERTDLVMSAGEHEACRIALWNWASASNVNIDPNVIVGVELMLELEIGDWTIRGKLDRAEIADGQGWIYDYKSQPRPPDQEAFSNDFQQQFYALLMAEGVPEDGDVPLGQGLDGFHLTGLYPRSYDKESRRIGSRYAFKDRGQIHDFRRTVEAGLAKLTHGLKTNEWAAADGSWCSRCPMPQECPIPPAQREYDSFGSLNEVMEAASNWDRSTRDLKRVRESIKEWANESGIDIPLGDQVLTFTPKVSQKIRDKDELRTFIEANGGEWEQFFRREESVTFGKKKAKDA